MRLAVCVKQVPDTSVRLEADESGLRLRTSSYLPVLNPYDEFALEEALRLREEAGGGEVVVLTLASEPVDETVFHALAMGADRALVLEAREETPPRLAALCLAGPLKRLRADLVFCGERSVDDEAAAFGPALAEALGWTQVCGVETVRSLTPPRLRALCRRGCARHLVEADAPCVASFLRGPRLPRYPSMQGIFGAREKPCERLPAEAGKAALRRISLQAPPEARACRRLSGPPKETAEALLRMIDAR